ncbi:MAG: dihydroorotase [Bacteroidales bacterium]|nr:dihydroorotase [Bacteroidales bacterium]
MAVLFKGGFVSDNGRRVPVDILVDGSVIVDAAPSIPEIPSVPTVHMDGCLVSFGFADVHVHFREPGYSVKETIRTGSEAAAAGGYTTVCTMPNLNPVPDSEDNLSEQLAIIARDAVVEVLPYCSITKGRKGLEPVDMHSLKGSCVGFSDDGSGVQDEAVMKSAMRLAAAEDCLIAAHCEDNALLRGGYIHDGRWCREHGHAGICSESEWGQISRDLELCREVGCHYHVCHISTKESVEVIRKAKSSGVRVTCETAPHYLVLCEDDMQEDGRFKMNPPLRSAEDRAALIEGVKDGTIDMIATDHAPHTMEEKSRGLKSSAMGIVGLETAFPVLYTRLVKTGLVSLDRLLEMMCAAPRREFGLSGGTIIKGAQADLTFIRLDEEFVIDSGSFRSKGRSTPFDGWKVFGRTALTLYKGKTVYTI